MKKGDDGFDVAFGCLLLVFATAISIPLAAFAYFMLWTWFVVPLGAPDLGAWHLMGLALLVTAFTTRTATNSTKEGMAKIYDAVGLILTKPLFLLTFGFLYAWWGGLL